MSSPGARLKGATTRWWWVRHAVVPNPEARCYGQSDMDCDVSDKALFDGQARILPRNAVWVTSALLRARKTAQTLGAHGADYRTPIVEPAFNEQHFGALQGATYVEIARDHGDDYPYWLIHPTARAPGDGGESFVDLFERTAAAVKRLTAEHRGRDIVAVTHGGTIRAALGLALGLPPEGAVRFEQQNVSVTVIDHLEHVAPPHDWRVVMANRLPH